MEEKELVREIMKFMVEFESKVMRPAEMLARDTVSGVQLMVLLSLEHTSPIRMSDLAERKRISKSQMTAAVNALVKRKMVERISDEEDRRIILIQCTKEGKQFLKQLQEKMYQYILERVERLKEEERDDMLEALKKTDGYLKGF